MTARRTYSVADVRQMGVPAHHPKGFWYDPVAPKSRELAFFFGHRDPKKRWRWHQAPPELPQKGWRHSSDCWCEYAARLELGHRGASNAHVSYHRRRTVPRLRPGGRIVACVITTSLSGG